GYRRRLVDTYSGQVLFGHATASSRENWLPQLKASADPERIASFLSKADKAAELGYVQAPSDFVEGVIDICMPVMGMQGAVASLTVPYIAIIAQTVSPEQVLEYLRHATQKISEALSDDGR